MYTFTLWHYSAKFSDSQYDMVCVEPIHAVDITGGDCDCRCFPVPMVQVKDSNGTLIAYGNPWGFEATKDCPVLPISKLGELLGQFDEAVGKLIYY